MVGFLEHELVLPIRIHYESGKPISHGRHFLKRKKEKKKRLTRRKKRNLKTKKINNDFFHNLLLHFRSARNSHRIYKKRNPFFDVTQAKHDSNTIETMNSESDHFLQRDVANYSVYAFGKKFSFSLAPYNNFIASRYSLRYLGSNSGTKASPKEPRHCFYAGHVNGQRQHKVVVSLCQGMVSIAATC